MKLLISGDRHWKNENLIKDTITYFLPEVVIHGGSRGADTLANRAAKFLHIPVQEFPAKWNIHGKAAGSIRNQQMIDEGNPDLVVAFHDDIIKSLESADMLSKAEDNNIDYCLVMNWY